MVVVFKFLSILVFTFKATFTFNQTALEQQESFTIKTTFYACT